MDVKGWIYYNHAAIPTVSPHVDPNTTSIKDGSIWKMEGFPLLARWTKDFDCGYETNWWYIIKDTPFDIASLKAKRRYEIKKGKKNFFVKEIMVSDYLEKLYEITEMAYSSWNEKYRPNVTRDSFEKVVKEWDVYKVIGVFLRSTDELCGYILVTEQEKCVYFNVLRVNPEYEKMAINAAAVAGILERYESLLKNGGYICDGARSINHETAFQDYLEKYFCFRKAYCKLNIQYNPKIEWLIKVLYPFRNILKQFDYIGKVHLINSVFKMHEIAFERQKE